MVKRKIGIQSITIIVNQKRYRDKCQSISSIRARRSEDNGAINVGATNPDNVDRNVSLNVVRGTKGKIHIVTVSRARLYVPYKNANFVHVVVEAAINESHESRAKRSITSGIHRKSAECINPTGSAGEYVR